MAARGKRKIFVGLSGGVDSSVAASRLKDAGADVTGVFIKVWHPEFLPCNWEAERLDAMRVAAHLDIPFLTCDAEETYRDSVARYFIEGYTKGETPNPDVMCNKYVKFGAFIEFAKHHGADAVATGHYARTVRDGDTVRLLRGRDGVKDQSYFLWSVPHETLPHIHLPIGDSTKDAIRREAARRGLPTASKKDSQGICFLGHVDIGEFLSNYVTLTPGDVRDERGAVIGRHRGAIMYTKGQRHGFTIHTASDTAAAHYVIDKDIDANTITVSAEPPRLMRGEIRLRETNWLLDHEEVVKRQAHDLLAQTRYRQTPSRVQLTSVTGGHAMLNVQTAMDAPMLGQSCVIYDGDVCVGGGIVDMVS